MGTKIRVKRLASGSWGVIKPEEHVREHGCIPEYVVGTGAAALHVARRLVDDPDACRDWRITQRYDRRLSVGWEIPEGSFWWRPADRESLMWDQRADGYNPVTTLCAACGHSVDHHLFGCCSYSVAFGKTCGCTRQYA